jgi:hypothetical protein
MYRTQYTISLFIIGFPQNTSLLVAVCGLYWPAMPFQRDATPAHMGVGASLTCVTGHLLFSF